MGLIEEKGTDSGTWHMELPVSRVHEEMSLSRRSVFPAAPTDFHGFHGSKCVLLVCDVA